MGKIKKDFELLEPRILLDATLDFTVSDTLDNIATIETMSALIRSFEEQFDADEDGLLKLLRTELIGGLDGAEDLFSLVEGQEGSGFGELEDIFERVRLSGMQVVEDYRADLNAIFSDADYSEPVLDLRDGVRTYGTTGGGGSEFFDINAREFIRVNGVELPSGDTLNDYFRSSDVIEQIFGSELLWTAGNLADRVDAFFDGFTVETAFTIVDPDPAVPDVQSAFVEYVFEDDGAGGFTTINEFKAAFTETYDNVLAAADTTAAFNDLQTVSLVDVNDAGGGSLISFTQTSADEIGVSVQLPQIETFLDKLDLAENLRTILPVDFAFVGESGVFEYSIGGSTVVDDQGTTTAALTDINDDTVTASLTMTNFGLASDSADPTAIESLFEFGIPDAGDINYTDSLALVVVPETDVGFLTGTLTSFETGRFGLFDAGNTWTGLAFDGTVVATVDPAIALTQTATLSGQTAVDFALRATELDAESADQLTLLGQSSVVELVRFNFDMNLPLSLSLDAATGLGFGASLTQSVTLGSIGQDPTVAAFGNAVDVDFDITSFAGVDAEFIDPLNRLANALFDTGTDVIATFFEAMGDGVASVFNNAGFTLGIPFTDFDITDSFAQIADVLQTIPDLFSARPEDFGFVETVGVPDAFGIDETGIYLDLATDKTSLTGRALSDAQLDALALETELNFTVFGFDSDGGETRTVETVSIAGWAVRDVYGAITDDALDALAALIDTQLMGWAVSIVGRAFNFAVSGTGPIQSIGMDVSTSSTGLRDLGFVKSQLVSGADNGTEFAAFDVHRAELNVGLEAMDLDVLKGMSSVRFEIVVGDEVRLVDVVQPTGGWAVDAADPLQVFVDTLNAALVLKGIEIEASSTTFAGDPALEFDLKAGAEGRYKIGLDLESLTRANSLQGMFGWMSETVGDIPCLPGFEINVDIETGEVLFDFEPFVACAIDAAGNVTTGVPSVSAGLSLNNTSLGEFSNVDLQAQLDGTLSAEMNLAAGFNIFDIQADFAQSGAAKEAILDNVFFDALSLNAVLDAQATEIVAALDLGMVEIGVGTNGPDPANFIALNTELDMTIVGQSEGAFSNRLTGSQLIALGSDAGPGSRLSDLLGRIDLEGGIAVETVGDDVIIASAPGVRTDFDLPPSTLPDPAAAAAEDRQNVLDLVTIQNGDDRVAGQDYVMLAMNLESIDLGFGTLLPTIDEPIFTSVGDIFDPVNTTNIVYDIEELLCLTLVDPNLILDAMIGLGDVIEIYADNLEEFFPVLFEDVPLLNDALMASFDFTSGFNEALQDLRDAGGFSFENINDVFASAFGEGVATINLLTTDPVTGANICELEFNLDISFLDDFTQEIPFNFNLIELLGTDGLGALIEGADDDLDSDEQGDESVDVLSDLLTNLVDARADAALVLDPELGLNLNFGIDIAALGGLTLANATGATTLEEIANVTSVITNGAGFNDLRVNWVDNTTNKQASFSLDIDALLPQMEGDPEATIEDVVTALRAAIDADQVNTGRVAAEKLTVKLVDNGGEFTIEIKDPNSTARDLAGVMALFSDPSALSDDGGPQPVLAEAEEYPVRSIPLAASVDPELGYTFTINIAGAGPITIDVPAGPLRSDEDFVAALNTALNTANPAIPAATNNAILIANSDLDPTDTSGGSTPLLRLLLARLDDDTGTITLDTTAFANSQGWDEFSIETVDMAGALFGGTVADAGGAFEELATADPYVPRSVDLMDLDVLVPTEYEPRVLVVAPPLPIAAVPPAIPLPSDAFTLSINLTVPGSAQTDTIDLEIGEDPTRLTPQGLVDVLNDTLRTNADGTFRTLDLGTLTTSIETGSVAVEKILAGNVFVFELNDLGAVTIKTTAALQSSGLPELGFALEYTAVAAGLQTGGAVFGSSHATGTAWVAADASEVEAKFAIQIGDGDPIEVELKKDYGRATRADLVAALNQSLADAVVARNLISETAVIGTTTTLSQIMRFVANGNDLTLQTTNFTQVNGYEEFAFAVVGNDISHDITFEVLELEESNIARALGFKSLIELADIAGDPSLNVIEGDISSSVLKAKAVAHDAPIVFVDTDETRISANLSLGTPEGLNMVLALGPLEVGIDGGSAFIGASGGEGRGYIAGVVEDIDGQDDGRYDLAHLYGIFQSDDPDFLPLFGLDVDFETRIDLPFSGAFGALNPDDHGFIYESTLLRTTGTPGDPNDNSVSAAELFGTVEAALVDLYTDDPLASDTDAARASAIALLDTHFAGDAQALALVGLALTQDELDGLMIADLAKFGDTRAGARDEATGLLPADYYTPTGDAEYGPHYMDLNLPGVGLFDCAGILDLLNDPLAIVNGLDMMAGTIQGFIDEFVGDLDLPLIGENLAVGAGFFSDFVYDALDEVRADLETPLPSTGALPTSLDLINVLMNRALNDMFDTTGQTYIAAAVLEGDGEPAIYGSLSFNFEVFDADLAVDMALEIPGLNLDVDEGSEINLVTTLDIDLGFGLDCDGFFVLNDTDNAEIALVFAASANDFDGSFNIGGVLDVNAKATAGKDTAVTATIDLDLFGASGMATGAGLEIDRVYDFDEDAFLGLKSGDQGAYALDGARFDNTVYLSQINFGDFAAFRFNADVGIHLDLRVIFDVSGFVPEITTDFIFTAKIPIIEFGEPISTDILITGLKFDDIRLQTGTIGEQTGTIGEQTGTIGEIVGQVLNPIGDMLSPITDVFDVLSTTVPVSYAFNSAAAIFPILNVGTQISETLGTLSSLPTSEPNGICIGTYNFLGHKGEVRLSQFRASDAIFTPCFDFVLDLGYSAAVSGPGLDIKIPLLTDPSHALNLLLGNFDRVSLVEADFNLLQADINANIAAAITGNLGLPGWIAGAVRNAFTASVDIDFDAGFTVGYDLAGIVNFANSLDPERLLDGVFLDAAPGALIDGSIRGNFGLNAGIAGASGTIRGDVALTFTDPNGDGKLRLPELLAQAELAATKTAPADIIGAFFTGDISFGAALRIWGGINFPWPLPDLSFSTTVFDTTLFSYTLNSVFPDVAVADVFGAGLNSTAVLNVGARAGGNLSSISQDANDVITIRNNGFVEYSASGQVFSTTAALQTINPNAGVVIAAGEGNNTVNLQLMTSPTSATITYAGDGNDVINLAKNGTHVVFAGGGRDTINLSDGAGTYYIFAEDGEDTMALTTAAGGTVYVFGDGDFGMRDHFLSTFNVSGSSISLAVTEANIAAQFSSGAVNLGPAGTFADQFTRTTQLNGGSDAETVTIGGNGNANVFTGRGDDIVTVSDSGDARIYTGAGKDQINFTGTGTTHTEAGAGADLVTFTGGSNTAYGWGEISQLDEESGNFDHLMRADGDDIIIGEAGADTFFGQYGNDILGGGLGNDVLFGGFDDDLISGGILEVRSLDADGNVGASPITLTDPSAIKNIQTRLQVETADVVDGQDSLSGGAGSDILLGGGGNDTLSGGDGSDLVVGDYGKINMSSNRTAETFISTGMTSTTAGTDILDGGSGGDILVAGGAQAVSAVETITDLEGDNTVFGDFGVAEGSRILEQVNAFRAIASDAGTVDSITTGAGNDVIIGGERGDTIDAGLGGDFVIGDLGSFIPGDGIVNNSYVENGVIVDNTSPHEGDDQISFGVPGSDDLFDVALGGGGSDTITSVNGGLAAIGDYGQINLSSLGVRALLGLLPLSATASQDEIDAYNEQVALIERIVRSMETVDSGGNVYGDLGSNPRYGDDSITTTVGGNVYAILGGNTISGAGVIGGDTVSLADGLSYIITDDGRLTIEQLDDGAGGTFGQVKGESFSNEFAGRDTVTTANGRDIILTGDLADVVTAGDGLNIVMTDNGILETSDVPTAAPTTLTSAAGVGDGNDTYFGGAGDDLVVLGGGNSSGNAVTDSATLGEGDNYAMGDSGRISITLGVDGSQAVSLVSDPVVVGNNDGIDQITAGSSDDFVVLGGGGDIANLGDGATYVLASSGSLNTTSASDGRLTVRIMSADVVVGATDGDDTITAGLGDDFVVLGLGADTANLGDGTVHIIGGEGTLDFATTAAGERILDMTSQLAVLGSLDGNETITAGNGDDFIILGLGDDHVEAGDGENRVLGDQGRMSLDTAAGSESLTFLSPNLGGNDTVYGGADIDIVLLSQGDDLAETFDGDDLIAGDNATVTKNQNTGVHVLEADTLPFGGDDVIRSGEGDDLIVGSFGADTIETGAGDDFALGDLGNLTFRNATDVETLTYTTVDVGGGDIISASGAGSNILIGQFGDDVLLGADDDDLLIGDLSELQLSSVADVLPGQSHLERIEAVVSIRPDLGFDDTLNGAGGNDLLIGGFGGDSLLGGDGQDFLFGDTVDARRNYDVATQTETLELDTNFAFVTGGHDIMDGQAGADVVIGGLGTDLFFGNTQTDILAGDAFTAKYITYFPTGLVGATPFRQVDEVNFAAFSPVDLLTSEQVLTSLGVFEKDRATPDPDAFDPAGLRTNLVIPASQPIESTQGMETDPLLFLRVIEGFFEDEDIIRRISETVYFGVNLELAAEDLLEAFRIYLLEQGISELEINMVLFEAMLRRVLDDAGESPAPTTDVVVPAAESSVAIAPPPT